MARSKKKKVKVDATLQNHIDIQPGKAVRQDFPIQSADHLTVCWHLGKFDWDGPWGNKACGKLNFRQLLDHTISNWETMTWAELFRAGGGKAQGNNHHPIETSKLSSKAKGRLKDIQSDDVGSLVSLRVSSKVRLYGIRDGRAYQFLWYDPWHDIKKAVCPSLK